MLDVKRRDGTATPGRPVTMLPLRPPRETLPKPTPGHASPRLTLRRARERGRTDRGGSSRATVALRIRHALYAMALVEHAVLVCNDSMVQANAATGIGRRSNPFDPHRLARGSTGRRFNIVPRREADLVVDGTDDRRGQEMSHGVSVSH